MMELPPEWTELFESLCSSRVRFLIVGGHALAAHGSPRRTDDIDVFVEPTLANARRLGAALRKFGYPAPADAWRTFAERDRMATLGAPPLRIDLMTSISGVDFAQAWAGRVEQSLGPITLPFIGRDALLANKRASARLQDLADVAMLTGESELELARAVVAKAGDAPPKKRAARKPRPAKKSGGAR